MSKFRGYLTGGVRDYRDNKVVERKYGNPDIPSTEDHPKVDLRGYIDHVYNQGKLPNCTVNAACSAFKVVLMRQAAMNNIISINFEPSRLFVYYNSRVYDDAQDKTVGVTVRDALKVMYKQGICQESLWPYNIEKATEKPPPSCYQSALDNKVCWYDRVAQHMDQIRASLKAGFPFIFLFEVYDSFYSPDNEDMGIMPMPSDAEIQSEDFGVHTVLCVGYDESIQCIIVLNSWGESFGDRGYFYMPYEYITDRDRSASLWAIVQVSEKSLGPNAIEVW